MLFFHHKSTSFGWCGVNGFECRVGRLGFRIVLSGEINERFIACYREMRRQSNLTAKWNRKESGSYAIRKQNNAVQVWEGASGSILQGLHDTRGNQSRTWLAV